LSVACPAGFPAMFRVWSPSGSSLCDVLTYSGQSAWRSACRETSGLEMNS
jgi:hypothetical protein